MSVSLLNENSRSNGTEDASCMDWNLEERPTRRGTLFSSFYLPGSTMVKKLKNMKLGILVPE